MGKKVFFVGVQFRIDKDCYQIEQLHTNGSFVVRNIANGGVTIRTFAELSTLWQTNHLHFKGENESSNNGLGLEKAKNLSLKDFESLDPKIRLEAYRRYQIILPLLLIPREQITRRRINELVESLRTSFNGGVEADKGNVNKQIVTKHSLSISSVERWLHAFLDCDGDVRALAPKLGNRKKRSIVSKKEQDENG